MVLTKNASEYINEIKKAIEEAQSKISQDPTLRDKVDEALTALDPYIDEVALIDTYLPRIEQLRVNNILIITPYRMRLAP